MKYYYFCMDCGKKFSYPSIYKSCDSCNNAYRNRTMYDHCKKCNAPKYKSQYGLCLDCYKKVQELNHRMQNPYEY